MIKNVFFIFQFRIMTDTNKQIHQIFTWYLFHCYDMLRYLNFIKTLTQNKGKESENSYQKLRDHSRTGTRKLNRNISTGTAVFLHQKRANVCEHTTKMASLFPFPYFVIFVLRYFPFHVVYLLKHYNFMKVRAFCFSVLTE